MKEFLIKLLRGAFTCVDDYCRMREIKERRKARYNGK